MVVAVEVEVVPYYEVTVATRSDFRLAFKNCSENCFGYF